MVSHASKSLFLASLVVIIKAKFCSSQGEIVTELLFDPKKAKLQNHCFSPGFMVLIIKATF